MSGQFNSMCKCTVLWFPSMNKFKGLLATGYMNVASQHVSWGFLAKERSGCVKSRTRRVLFDPLCMASTLKGGHWRDISAFLEDCCRLLDEHPLHHYGLWLIMGAEAFV